MHTLRGSAVLSGLDSDEGLFPVYRAIKREGVAA